MLLTHKITTSGSLYCNFTFESEAQALNWLKTEVLNLEKKYPGLNPLSAKSIEMLDGLTIGDTCFVSGEGSDCFKIIDIVSWGAHRYGFLLDNGCTEEVAKCYKYPGQIKAHTQTAHLYDYFQTCIDKITAVRDLKSSKTELNTPVLGYLFGYKTSSVEEIEGKKSFRVKFFNGISETPPSKKLKNNKDYWESVVHQGDVSPLYVEDSQYPQYAEAVLCYAKNELTYNVEEFRSFEMTQLFAQWASCFNPGSTQERNKFSALIYAMVHTDCEYRMCHQQVSTECIKKFLLEYLMNNQLPTDVNERLSEYALFSQEFMTLAAKEYEDSIKNALA